MFKDKPRWEIEGRDWPNREASRFVEAAGFIWHVQVMGEGPPLLLLHGTGAATHSWRALAPILAREFTIVAPDLPGHGFTEMPSQSLSLPFMARSVCALLATLDFKPLFFAGHSAGAAIGLRMILDNTIAPQSAVSLNGALLPFAGAASFLFPALAKVLFLNPFAAPILAARASDPVAVKGLFEGTGSTLDANGLELYGRLLRTRWHVGAALSMMANWDLHALKADLSHLPIPLTLVSGGRDRAVPENVAKEVAALVPNAKTVCMKDYGHLAHEEAPDEAAAIIRNAFHG